MLQYCKTFALEKCSSKATSQMAPVCSFAVRDGENSVVSKCKSANGWALTFCGSASFSKALPHDVGVCVTAMLMANTDTRHYLHLTRNIYRFSPAYVTLEEARCVHGDDERISLWNYERLVNFYLRVIANSNADRLVPLAAPGRKAGEL